MLNKRWKKILLVFLLTMTFLNFNLATIALEQSGEMLADEITLDVENDNYQVTALRNVKIKYGDLLFTGEFAQFNTESKELLLNSGFKLKIADYLVTGDLLEGNFEHEEYTITGNVDFSTMDFLVKAELVVFTKEEITFKEEASFQFGELQATAEKITYDLENEIAILEGNVLGKRNGQKFSAEMVTVNIGEEKVNLSGQATLIFSDRGESE